MKTGAAVVGFVFTGAIGLAVGYAIGQSKNTQNLDLKAGTKVADVPSAAEETLVRVPVGNSFTKGPADALVTIVEFSDFQCPFCSRVGPTLKQIHSTYGDKVRVAFKHNPLPFHQEAPLASEYALAAGDQGKFWEMHDKLFENQKALQPADLERYAGELGLDVGKIKAFIDSGKGKAMIKEDQALAARVGARGTPAFFINGVSLSGAQPFDAFKKVIDAQLAKAEQMVKSGTPKGQVYAKLMERAKDAPPPPAAEQRPQPPPATRQAVAMSSGAPTKGGKEPLVVVSEWSDFECPFCGRALPTMEEMLKTYGDKVALQFRHQPLSFHKNAMPAAKASMAAHRQGKFWEYHDKLFQNQRALGEEDLVKYAQELGLNVARFKQDMADSAIDAQIQADMAEGNKFGARGTPTFFVNGVPVRGAQPFPAFKAVIDKELELAEKLMKEGVARKDVAAEIVKREAGKEVAGAAPSPQPAAPAEPTGPVNVSIGKAPSKGNPKSKVKIILYSDFECPFCSRVNPSIKKLEEEFGDKIEVAFKHYPLPFHKNAELAAVASMAAHRQGKFWPMHDKLFENQRALGREDLLRYAGELGLDKGKFEKDLGDTSLLEGVKADMAEGSKIGVNGTPATFINGYLVSGAQPYENFKQIVERELKKAGAG